MLLLALNSSTLQTEVALVDFHDEPEERTEKKKNGAGERAASIEVIFEKSWRSERDEAEKILPTIQKAFQNSGRKELRPDRVFVVRGPGHFSGLRIGVTIANALAYSWGTPMISVDTFEMLLHKILPEKRDETATILPAGGANFALMLPGKKTPELGEASTLSPLIARQKNIQYIMADLRSGEREKFEMMEAFSSRKIQWIPKKFTQQFSRAVIELANREIQADLPKGLMIVSPQYLQKPVITKSKKKVFTTTR